MGIAGVGFGKVPVTARGGGSNERLNIGVVGCGGQGAENLERVAGENIIALCDVDENVLNKRLGEVESSGKKRPAAFTDVRKLLEDKSIDAISIATPNHWHSLIGIWACQAGKDVYVEKPCSHNIFEGRQLVAAAQKYNRIVQHGTNSRSGPAVREAVDKNMLHLEHVPSAEAEQLADILTKPLARIAFERLRDRLLQ